MGRLIERTAQPLVEVDEQITAAVIRAKVLHQEETGLDVNTRRAWMHGTSTKNLTHFQVHQSRGTKALDAIGILANVTGVSVHDCWATDFRSDCYHTLCMVRLVRELTFVAEALGLWWAATLKRLLLTMKDATEQARSHGLLCLSPPEVAAFPATFVALLSEGDPVHPRVPTPAGTRGNATQHPNLHLLDRLRTSQDAVVRFLTNLTVPFDNTLADTDLRMMKLRQKMSGCFRTVGGSAIFCALRNSVSTMQKQGVHLLTTLALFSPLPS